MPPKCVCTGKFPGIGPKGCTFNGLPKTKRVGKKPGPKPGSHNPKKRKFVTAVQLAPSKRVKSVTAVQTVLGKRKGAVADPTVGIFSRLRKRIRG